MVGTGIYSVSCPHGKTAESQSDFDNAVSLCINSCFYCLQLREAEKRMVTLESRVTALEKSQV